MPDSLLASPCRRSPSLLLAGLLFLATANPPAFAAAAPVLVHDFQPGVQLAPPAVSRLASYGSLVAMAASDEAHGEEPFLSDGSAAGTRRLADLVPGPAGSAPRGFLDVGGRLLFLAEDAGQSLLFSSSGFEGEEPTLLATGVQDAAVLGSRAYFQVRTASFRSEIWETDGTAEGTSLVADLCPAEGDCSRPGAFFPFGDALYFQRDSTFYRLSAGGQPVVVGPLGNVRFYLPLDASRFLMAVAEEGIFDSWLLWVSDGTAAGTFALESSGGAITRRAHDLVAANGRVYGSDANGALISTDGTAAGTRLEPGFPPGAVRLLARVSAGLLYSVDPGSVQNRPLRVLRPDGTHHTIATTPGDPRLIGAWQGQALIGVGDTLVRSDGTSGGTAVVGAGLRTPAEISATESSGFLYFAAHPVAESGPEGLYRLSATGQVQAAVAKVTAPSSSDPRSYPAASRLVVAAGTSGSALDEEDHDSIWRIDPVTFAAVEADPGPLRPLASNGSLLYAQRPAQGFDGSVVAIGPAVTTPLGAAGRVTEAAADARGALLFGEEDPGQELWEADAAGGHLTRITDFLSTPSIPGYCHTAQCAEDRLPGLFTRSGENLYFLAVSHPPASAGLDLFVRQGSAAPEHLFVLPGHTFAFDYPTLVPLPGGRLATLDTSSTHHLQIHLSDGTPAGTRLFSESLVHGGPDEGAAVGGRLVVTSYPGLFSLDLRSGESRQLFTGDANRLTASGERVFFVGNQEGQGAKLWCTDGLSAAGTRRLDLRPGLRSALGPDAEVHSLGDGRVVFAADEGVHGNELWISDCSPEGTFRLTDIAPGRAAANPRHFLRRGDRLFFAADDGEHGSELWALDLPAPLPPCPAKRLCLLGGRFEAEVTATVNGRTFVGQRALASSESGVFTFFGPDNWEMMVKLLDGCAINQRFWVFASAATDVEYRLDLRDRATGENRTYLHEAGSAARPEIDLDAFAGCSAPAPAPSFSSLASAPLPAQACSGDGAALCLGQGGRFRVTATWETAADLGEASPVPYGSLESGLFTFFSPTNWELLVKVLDGCALNGKHWIYAAGTTDVGWRLEVEDLVTHERKVYENRLGQPSVTITDSQALGGCD